LKEILQILRSAQNDRPGNFFRIQRAHLFGEANSHYEFRVRHYAKLGDVNPPHSKAPSARAFSEEQMKKSGLNEAGR